MTLRRSRASPRCISNSTLSLVTVPFPCHPTYRHLPFLLHSAQQGFLLRLKNRPSTLADVNHVMFSRLPSLPVLPALSNAPKVPWSPSVPQHHIPSSKRDLVATASATGEGGGMQMEQPRKPGMTGTTLIFLQSCPVTLEGNEKPGHLRVSEESGRPRRRTFVFRFLAVPFFSGPIFWTSGPSGCPRAPHLGWPHSRRQGCFFPLLKPLVLSLGFVPCYCLPIMLAPQCCWSTRLCSNLLFQEDSPRTLVPIHALILSIPTDLAVCSHT